MESEMQMNDEEQLRERHRQQAYRVVAIRALERVLREHITPRMKAEARDQSAALHALESVDGFLRSWRAAEASTEDALAKKLEFGVPPDEWKYEPRG
jgi:hypothetical protein